MIGKLFSLLLLTLNVPLQLGKSTPRGTCTPVWQVGTPGLDVDDTCKRHITNLKRHFYLW